MPIKEKADRAKQFLPFDALKGFKEALREREKILVPKIELSEEDSLCLSQKLSQIQKGSIIKVTYFLKGEYIELEGMVSAMNATNQTLTIVKKKIAFQDIFDIKGQCIKVNDFEDQDTYKSY